MFCWVCITGALSIWNDAASNWQLNPPDEETNSMLNQFITRWVWIRTHSRKVLRFKRQIITETKLASILVFSEAWLSGYLSVALMRSGWGEMDLVLWWVGQNDSMKYRSKELCPNEKLIWILHLSALVLSLIVTFISWGNSIWSVSIRR